MLSPSKMPLEQEMFAGSAAFFQFLCVIEISLRLRLRMPRQQVLCRRKRIGHKIKITAVDQKLNQSPDKQNQTEDRQNIDKRQQRIVRKKGASGAENQRCQREAQ